MNEKSSDEKNSLQIRINAYEKSKQKIITETQKLNKAFKKLIKNEKRWLYKLKEYPLEIHRHYVLHKT